MIQGTDAVYGKGAPEPLPDLDLRESPRVPLTIEPIDQTRRSTELRPLTASPPGMVWMRFTSDVASPLTGLV
jgi:hypothetical protein